MTIPRAAVRNRKVNLLDGNKIVSSAVSIVGSKPDSVFVVGLEDGQKVLLEQLGKVDAGITYKGITR